MEELEDKKNNIENYDDSYHEAMGDYIEKSYLNYAMYVILDRALPSICDGLKPVHRRILYSMSELKLYPDSKYKKSARTIGDVLGKYHPHGDSACYEAMVMLAQPFSTRHPLVDGQGNWGSIDDPGSFAAMRYTESKLTKYSGILLDEVDPRIVDWESNFDGSLQEPSELPARLPNILVNGSSGIAVGLATDILPHNLGEVGQACIRLIDDKDTEIKDIMKYIKGPDFPTGGDISTSREDIYNIYKEGRGSIKVRAKYRIEDGNIIFYEIPYKTSTSKIIEKIGDQIKNKKNQLIEDIFDYSDQDSPVKIIVTPKKKVDHNILIQHLFATTQLEQNIKVNMNAINMDGVPQQYNVKSLLLEWLDFRRKCIYRRTQALLDKTQARLHILEGYEKVFDAIDFVIDIIKNYDFPFEELKEKLELSDIQAKHIMDIRLRSLAKLEQSKIIDEKNKLIDRESFCISVVDNPSVLDSIMRDEICNDISLFSDERRTSFSMSNIVTKEVDDSNMLPSEKTTVIISGKGWIRAGKGEIIGDSLTYKSGDYYLDSDIGKSNDIISVFDNEGKVYNISYNELPNARGYGEPLSTKISNNGNNILFTKIIKNTSKYVYVNKNGYGFLFEGGSCLTKKKAGKRIFNLSPDESYFKPIEINEENTFIISTLKGKIISFGLDEIKELDKGKGVQLIKLDQDDKVYSFYISKGDNFIVFDDKKFELSTYIGPRGRKGKSVIKDLESLYIEQKES